MSARTRRIIIGLLFITTAGLAAVSIYVGTQIEDDQGGEDAAACAGVFCAGCVNRCVTWDEFNSNNWGGCNDAIDALCDVGPQCAGEGVAADGRPCCQGLVLCGNGRCDTSCVNPGGPSNAACTLDSQCPSNEICENDQCVSGSRTNTTNCNNDDNNCPATQWCSGTECVGKRAAGGQCNRDRQCLNNDCNDQGICQPVTTQPPVVATGNFTCPNPPNQTAVICAVYDCPNGDTNGDGECLASDEGVSEAFYTSNCPSSPPSGCGQIDFYTGIDGSRPDFSTFCGYSFLNFDNCSDDPNPFCGDGNVDPGEECDDGNQNNDDGCRNNCTRPPSTPNPICGDGNVDPGEECDDGNQNNNDECRNDCTIPPDPALCGDGFLDPGEECDNGDQNGVMCTPGYDSSCQYCSEDCTTITEEGPFCGDGIVQDNEECDPNTATNSCTGGGTCSSACTCSVDNVLCGESCTSDSQCPVDHSCTNGTCVLDGCTGSNCVNGCVPLCGGPCNQNSDCPTGHSCDQKTDLCVLNACLNDPNCTNNGCKLPVTGLFDGEGENDQLIGGIMLLITSILIYKLGIFQRVATLFVNSEVRFVLSPASKHIRKDKYERDLAKSFDKK